MAKTDYTCEPAEDKKRAVSDLVTLFEQYPVIGTINVRDLPASQLAVLRGKLRDKMIMRMTKRRLMKIALSRIKNKPGIGKLVPHLEDMPALVFTKENPFSLFKTIKKNKSPAPAKAGQKAPRNIVVSAGPTPFAPGPVIGELGALGIKSKVEGGKITIIADTVVAKEGAVISQKLAEMLIRLNIQPMEVGLDLRVLFENGEILPRSLLDIDEEQYLLNITQCAQWAFNLAIETAYPTKDTTEFLIQKAFRDAKAVALEGSIATKETVGDLLALAQRQAASLGGLVK